MRNVIALVVVTPLVLLGCGQQGAPPVIVPVPLPQIEMPAYVQQACSVLRWAVPIATGMIHNLPPAVVDIVERAQPALAACAAGNATEAITALAVELQKYLMARGVRPPVGMPILAHR